MRGHIKTNQDWWIAAICIRIETVGCDGRKRNTSCVNHPLIHAQTLAQTYDKAVVIGRRSEMKCEAPRDWMKDRLVGIWQILRVWDDTAVGEELLWDDCGGRTARVAKRQCRSKRQVLADYQRPFGKIKRPGTKP